MMGKGSDYLFFTNKSSFRNRLPKLDNLVYSEGLRLGANFDDFHFVNCESTFDIIDVQYSNGIEDFDISCKGSEKHGYKILNSEITEALNDDDIE